MRSEYPTKTFPNHFSIVTVSILCGDHLMIMHACAQHSLFILSLSPLLIYSQGLHPESHGIVNNFFYDVDLQEEFRMPNDESMTKSQWWLGEPVSYLS